MTPMPGKRTDLLQSNRREVITGGLVVQVSLLASAAGTQCAEANASGPDTRPADDREPRYRETAHVRIYYDRSRF